VREKERERGRGRGRGREREREGCALDVAFTFLRVLMVIVSECFSGYNIFISRM
jgi:hypothetical protein